eukprot:m.220709 g.220709  ORF g.220709 m.220709 type:complete len:245 (-) comp10438_c0_seq1:93-827(-)
MEVSELFTYREQLAQVQAALSADPDNEQLQKLAADLKEMIALSSKLVQAPHAEQEAAGTFGTWNVGDECEAVWSEDGKYYRARIDKISDNGLTCSVIFLEYGNSELVKLASLRSVIASKEAAIKDEVVRKHALDTSAVDVIGAKRSKEMKAAQRKSRKEKTAKWLEKKAELDSVGRDEANKWKSFSTVGPKAKSLGTYTKKSIFSTPDNPEARVGVGTCGIGGKGMTTFSQRGKWHFEGGDAHE